MEPIYRQLKTFDIAAAPSLLRVWPVGLGLGRSWLVDPLAEANKITERINHTCLKHRPRHPFETGLHVWVVF